MRNSYTKLLCGITVLAGALLIGSPIEVMDATTNRIAAIVLVSAFTILFILLFKETRKVINIVSRRTFYILITVLAIPYLYIGLLTMALATSRHYPMWEDNVVYTNTEGEKIISQFQETSGSLHSYRLRKQLVELGQIRISLDWSKSCMKGAWSEHQMKGGSTLKPTEEIK